MKTTSYLLLIVLLFSISFTHAQTRHFGVRVGINYSDLYSLGSDVDVNERAGYVFGVLGEFKLNAGFGVNASLQFSRKGHNVGIDSVSYYFKPVYLQLPLRLHYQIGPCFLSAGPQIAWGIGGKVRSEKVTSRNFLYSNRSKHNRNLAFGYDKNDDFVPLDLGFGAEMGIHISPALRLSVHGETGFNHVFPNSDRYPEINHIWNILWGISLTFLDIPANNSN